MMKRHVIPNVRTSLFFLFIIFVDLIIGNATGPPLLVGLVTSQATRAQLVS